MSNYRYIPMQFYDSLADAKRTLKENSLTALQLQLSLLEWLERQASIPAYQSFITTHGHRPVEDDATRQMLGEFLHRQVRDMAGTASTHWINDDMSAIVNMAALDMKPSGLRAPDLPTDTGWMVFERPVPLFFGGAGGDPTEVRIAAIGWQVGTVRRAPLSDAADGATDPSAGQLVPGVSYYLFQTAHDAAVLQNTMAERRGDEVRVTEDEIVRSQGPLPIFDFSGWAYDTPWNTVSVVNEEQAGYSDEQGAQYCHAVVDQARRLLLAAWRIFRQKNIVQRDVTAQPNHQLRKRAARVSFTPEINDIVIISMRTTVYRGLQKKAAEAAAEDGEEEPTSWYRCKFFVRGHWHPYWTGPRVDEPCEHNLVEIPDSDDLLCTLCGRTLIEKYVLPYPKGNPNGPLLLHKHILSLEQ